MTPTPSAPDLDLEDLDPDAYFDPDLDPDADLDGADVDNWFGTLRPVGALQEWLARRVILASVRLRRYGQQENALWAFEALRARLTWHEDRRLAAAEVGAKLARDPARHAPRLEATRHGAEWLAARWRALAAIADSGQPWTDAQRSLALDLLGRPRNLRHDADDPTAPPAQCALAHAQLAYLESLLADRLIPRDEHERSLAAAGLSLPLGPGLTRLQRLEAHWRREFDASYRALRALQQSTDPAAPPSPPKPRPAPAPAPAPVRDPIPDDLSLARMQAVLSARSADEILETPGAAGNRKARRAQARRERSAR